MSEMIDPVLMCIYCSDMMDMPTEHQLGVFGFPECCEEKMLKIERNRIFQIVKSIPKLKEKLEQEILRGQL